MPPSLPASANLPKSELWFILVLIGFSATVAQIVLMRELMTIAYGNEVSLGLMLASWLLWTAFRQQRAGASRSAFTKYLLVTLAVFVIAHQLGDQNATCSDVHNAIHI